jgi:predicted enzyme related to lactoylglutathione lyase
MGAIKDPTGAFLFLWNPHDGASTSQMVYMRPGALSWADLNTRDPERAVGFYEPLFGWEISEPDESPVHYRQISVDGQGQGGIMAMPEGSTADGQSFWMPYFGSRDVRRDAERVRELGGMVFGDVQDIDDMVRFAIVADPAGAVFALMEPIGTMHW